MKTVRRLSAISFCGAFVVGALEGDQHLKTFTFERSERAAEAHLRRLSFEGCIENEIERDYDYLGDDLRRVEDVDSAEECAFLCGIDFDCMSFTYGTASGKWWTRTCFLKRSYAPGRRKSNGLDSGRPCNMCKNVSQEKHCQGGCRWNAETDVCMTPCVAIAERAKCRLGCEWDSKNKWCLPERKDPCADVLCPAVVCPDGSNPPVPPGGCCGDLSMCPDPCANVLCTLEVCPDGSNPPVPPGGCCGDVSMCPKFTIKIRGDAGGELFRFLVGGEEETVTLTKEDQEFTFAKPASGQFSITFLNDNGPRNGRVAISLPTSVDFHAFEQWNCGKASENVRCKYVRDGLLAWNGEYKYTLL